MSLAMFTTAVYCSAMFGEVTLKMAYGLSLVMALRQSYHRRLSTVGSIRVPDLLALDDTSKWSGW